MTLDQLIKNIDMHLPGNRFDNQAKTMWVNEVEGKIFEEIVKPTLNVGGTELRKVRKIGDHWYYKTEIVNRSPEELKDTDADSTGNEKNIIDAYVAVIDPLDMMPCCCSGSRRNTACLEMEPYSYPEDAERQLIAQDRFCDVYVHYVLAKMHAADSEIDEYNNEVLLYEASYSDYAAWHIRNFRRNI